MLRGYGKYTNSDPKVFNYLKKIYPGSWESEYFPASRFGNATSNIPEYLNRRISHERISNTLEELSNILVIIR
ncbi:hypothetical protein AYI69_g283 [Smittium culicis]|uniref:Uncharacterized protein n=1 Tax=Smittium culicis TaxID=133412 RepID=A0A1R1YTH5_9FUNG|nr:hypothetical protein AYI69_g283 [Smittium culicis]